MTNSSTTILNHDQIKTKINRIAFQIYEDNYDEKEIIIAGIMNTGFKLAERIDEELRNICKIKVRLAPITLDKKNPINRDIETTLSKDDVRDKVVILVDDVLNSGRTLAYGIKALLDADVKKLRTVLLVDRDHKRYPVVADFVGLTLSTTLQEHITVKLNGKKDIVFLS